MSQQRTRETPQTRDEDSDPRPYLRRYERNTPQLKQLSELPSGKAISLLASLFLEQPTPTHPCTRYRRIFLVFCVALTPLILLTGDSLGERLGRLGMMSALTLSMWALLAHAWRSGMDYRDGLGRILTQCLIFYLRDGSIKRHELREVTLPLLSIATHLDAQHFIEDRELEIHIQRTLGNTLPTLLKEDAHQMTEKQHRYLIYLVQTRSAPPPPLSPVDARWIRPDLAAATLLSLATSGDISAKDFATQIATQDQDERVREAAHEYLSCAQKHTPRDGIFQS